MNIINAAVDLNYFYRSSSVDVSIEKFRVNCFLINKANIIFKRYFISILRITSHFKYINLKMKLLIVSVFLVVVETSFCVDNKVHYVSDVDWSDPSTQPSRYGDEDLQVFEAAVATKDVIGIKVCLSYLFRRLRRGEWINDYAIERNNKGASKIKTRIQKDLTKLFSRSILYMIRRILFRSALSTASHELTFFHFDCAYEWLDKRIKILKKEEKRNASKSRDTKSEKQKELQSERIDQKEIPENIEFSTYWLSQLEYLQEKVEAARNKVKELNEALNNIKSIKDLLKDREKIPYNTKEITEFANKIVETNERSNLAQLTSEIIDYLEKITGFKQKMKFEPKFTNLDTESDDDFAMIGVSAIL